MSRYCDETYDVYHEEKRGARRRHICGACKEEIQPGHKYWVIKIVYDQRAETIKRCLKVPRDS